MMMGGWMKTKISPGWRQNVFGSLVRFDEKGDVKQEARWCQQGEKSESQEIKEIAFWNTLWLVFVVENNKNYYDVCDYLFFAGLILRTSSSTTAPTTRVSLCLVNTTPPTNSAASENALFFEFRSMGIRI